MTERAETIAAALRDTLSRIVGKSVAADYALKIGCENMAERADALLTARENPPAREPRAIAPHVSCETREAEEDANDGPRGEDYWRGCST